MVKVREINPGSRVVMNTKKGEVDCTILESPVENVILVKLKSGYNIGIREEDIINIVVKHNTKEENEDKEGKVKLEQNAKKSEIFGASSFKQTQGKKLPNIAIISTGGTISSRLDTKTGAVKWLSEPEELLKFYPGLLEIANVVKIETPFMKASENMEFSDWKILADTAGKLLNNKEIDGVIITHGTDFLHYSAAALSFALRNLNKPVVLTYSQRSSDRASSDAALNLECAARAAVSDIAEVMLVGHANLDDEYCYALIGTKVRKMHSSRRDTFRPINTVPIAKVYPDTKRIAKESNSLGDQESKSKILDGIEKIGESNLKDENKKVEVKSDFNPKVALIKFYPGQDPEILEHYFEKGYKGVVVEMSGLGHVLTEEAKNNWLPKLKKLINAGFVVCAVPQTLYGALDPMVYSVGRKLEKTGIIYLKDMLPECAFVKLGWVLGQTKDREKIKEMMLTNYAKEFNERLTGEEFLN